MGRILAIDYGTKRTGLAVTDSLRIAANPLLTIETKHLIDWLKDYTSREPVDEIVIGLPRQMNGSDSATMPGVRQCESEIRKALPDIVLKEYDERFTSVIAHQAMIAGGMKKKRRQDKSEVDRLAACVILEGYMESTKDGSTMYEGCTKGIKYEGRKYDVRRMYEGDKVRRTEVRCTKDKEL